MGDSVTWKHAEKGVRKNQLCMQVCSKRKEKRKSEKKVVLKEKRSLNRAFTEHIIRVSDVDQLLQQFATFLVEHFADSRIVSNGE